MIKMTNKKRQPSGKVITYLPTSQGGIIYANSIIAEVKNSTPLFLFIGNSNLSKSYSIKLQMGGKSTW